MAVQAARLAQRGQALEQERDRVRQQVETTTRVKTLVSDLFKWVDPNEAHGSPAERLQEASRRIVQNLDGEPEIQSELMDEVLTIYMNLGLYQAALEMAQASLEIRRATFGPRDPAVDWDAGASVCREVDRFVDVKAIEVAAPGRRVGLCRVRVDAVAQGVVVRQVVATV